MKFLLDENAELRLARFLRERGHDVTAIVRDYPTALPDEDVLAIAMREGRVLITNDRDFEHYVIEQGRPHAGVIFFRLPQGRIELKTERLAHVLEAYANRLDHFIEVTEREVVVRSPAPNRG
jgi:predicted nuclease of predicted toxin-antitoxin system